MNIKSILENYQRGNFDEALSGATKLIKAAPDNVQLHNLMGAIYTGKKIYPSALECYLKAIALEPNNAELHNNLGAAYQATGAHQQAEASFLHSISLNNQNTAAKFNLANTKKALGDINSAISHYRQAIEENPDATDWYNNLAIALMEKEQYLDAEHTLLEAKQRNPDNPRTHYNLGLVYLAEDKDEQAEVCMQTAVNLNPAYADAQYSLGRFAYDSMDYDTALTCFNKAVELQPENCHYLVGLGRALGGSGRHTAAQNVLLKANRLAPRHLGPHIELGNLFHSQGIMEEAISWYRSAIDLDRSKAEAHLNLCEALERTNQLEALEAAVGEAASALPHDHPGLLVRTAELHLRKNEYQHTIDMLSHFPAVDSSHRMLHSRAQLLAEANDRLGNYDVAFSCFEEANEEAKLTKIAATVDGQNFLRSIDKIEDYFSKGSVTNWTDEEAPDNRKDPVFLIGFPRSGTTLLDTILRSHSTVAVVEEKPGLSSALSLLQGYPQSLENLSVGEVRHLRQRYFSEMDKHLLESDAKATLLIDKLPLNIVHVGAIKRLFPQAKLLLALRHPCDCVLSCFMQSFKLNDSMANFLTLEDSAHVYNRVMTVWKLYTEELELSFHTNRYESLVQDFEGTLRPTLDYLGLEWSDDLHDYRNTALKRGRIHTPSYKQVTQPIYNRSSGRWANYSNQLEPIMPILQPWIEYWGYDS